MCALFELYQLGLSITAPFYVWYLHHRLNHMIKSENANRNAVYDWLKVFNKDLGRVRTDILNLKRDLRDLKVKVNND